MQSFSVAGISAERFATKVRRSLNMGPLKGIVKFEQSKPDQIHISFSQLGTSHMYYGIEENGDGFTAKKANEKISFTHGAFKNQVETELTSLMKRLGAEVH